MKMITGINKFLSGWSDKLQKRLIEAQKETAKQLWEDVINFAPAKSGDYISSIKISDTEVTKNKIVTSVYTDLTSETGDGKSHAVGRMIEHGTGIYALEPHIGTTKKFIDSGYQYWYVPVRSVKRAIGEKININGAEFYIAHAQPAKPHFHPALVKNKPLYIENIRKAVKGK